LKYTAIENRISSLTCYEILGSLRQVFVFIFNYNFFLISFFYKIANTNLFSKKKEIINNLINRCGEIEIKHLLRILGVFF
jgi:hypothetical protein